MKYVTGFWYAQYGFFSRLALPGPPFLTDDPEPVECQHHELYIASQLSYKKLFIHEKHEIHEINKNLV